jgi:hypothetical protein
MVEDRPEEIEPSPDSGRAKRAPPTIDLEATEISGETQNTQSADADAAPKPSPRAPSAAGSTAFIAAVTGAAAAALVIAVVWLSGWPAVPQTAVPQANTAAIDALASRVAEIEARVARPAAAAPDPALAGRLDALEKSVAALRGDLAGLRTQSEKLAADLKDVKSAPRDSTAAIDLSGINERIAQIERATRAQSAATAQADAKPADDAPLRRIVAAALLDVMVRTGEPYAAALAAAKSLAPSPDALKPLEGFAATGVPNPFNLSRELLALVPKLSPPAEASATTGSGLVERLQAGASKLVRIERTDTSGTDRGNVVARVTAAALRNDVNEARRELKTLAPADRAAAQAWIDKADARDAALAASRQFAAEAMTALAKPGQ